MMRTTPFLRTTLHFGQRRLTEVETFIVLPPYTASLQPCQDVCLSIAHDDGVLEMRGQLTIRRHHRPLVV